MVVSASEFFFSVASILLLLNGFIDMMTIMPWCAQRYRKEKNSVKKNERKTYEWLESVPGWMQSTNSFVGSSLIRWKTWGKFKPDMWLFHWSNKYSYTRSKHFSLEVVQRREKIRCFDYNDVWKECKETMWQDQCSNAYFRSRQDVSVLHTKQKLSS